MVLRYMFFFMCDRCKYSAEDSYIMKKHKMNHTGRIIFTCNYVNLKLPERVNAKLLYSFFPGYSEKSNGASGSMVKRLDPDLLSILIFKNRSNSSRVSLFQKIDCL